MNSPRRAARSRGDEECDLAGFRVAIRDDLERTLLDRAKSEYVELVLAEIVDGADIVYPDLMLDEQINGMLDEFEANLKQRGVKLDDYLRMTNSSSDDLREQYQEPAKQSLRQSLVLRELVSAQEIEISEDDIQTRLEHVIAGYGTSDSIRKLFDTPQMKGNIRNELMMSLVNAHLFAIGRGVDAAAAVEELHGQMAADAERARERSERLQRYTDEDQAAVVENAADDERRDAETEAANHSDEVNQAATIQDGND